MIDKKGALLKNNDSFFFLFCIFSTVNDKNVFVTELIKNGIPLLNSPSKTVRERAYSSMCTLLNQEPITKAVKMIWTKIEQLNFSVYPEMIDCLV